MADIASLGIRVTTQGAKEAAADLDKLKTSGDRAATATQATSKAFSGTAKTARELQFATRGLPAQFTDIATSLASGQKPMLVLLQQGGQIKDIFGGVGPALRAVGGYAMGLINPFTLAAAAVAALGLAWAGALERAQKFNHAIALTGNYARQSADDLRQMASEISQSTGASVGDTSDALAEILASGRVAAGQLQMVTEAAIKMQMATGQATEQTIKDFAGLADAPTEYILRLNEAGKVNHFLTEEVAQQIHKLEEQGRTADAAALAAKAYASAINDSAGEVTRNLSTSAGLWRDIKGEASSASSAVGEFFRNADIGAQGFLRRHESIVAAFRRLQTFPLLPFSGAQGFVTDSVAGTAKRNAGQGGGLNFNVPGLSQGSAAFNATDGKLVGREWLKQQEAQKKFFEDGLRYGSEREQLEQRILAMIAQGRKDGIEADKLRARAAQMRAEFEEKSAKSGGGRSRGGRSSVARALPDFGKTAAADAAKLAEQEDRATQSFLDMAATLNGPLAEAEREHAKRVQHLNELAAQSPTAAQGLTDALAKEAAAHQKNMEAIKAEMDPLGQLLGDMEFELSLIGKSNAERAVMIELRRNHIDVMSAEAQAALATADAFETEAAAKQRSIDLMDDFRRGAADALTDFVTGAKSAKDALKDFFDSMADAITRAIAEQWMDKLFGKQGSDQSGSAGGLISSILGMFGGGSANGNAFVNGQVQAFANGGVVNSPTFFGMSGGRFGVMGEGNKPEAILPLHRGPDGKLGVRMEAANDDRRIVNNVTTFVLPQTTTPQTQAQIAQNQQRAATRATSRNR